MTVVVQIRAQYVIFGFPNGTGIIKSKVGTLLYMNLLIT